MISRKKYLRSSSGRRFAIMSFLLILLCLLLYFPATQGFITVIPTRTTLQRHRHRKLQMLSPNDMMPSTNLIGGQLQPCSYSPETGYFRDGFCNTCQVNTSYHFISLIIHDRLCKPMSFDLVHARAIWDHILYVVG